MFELAGIGKAKMDFCTGKFLRVNRKLCEMLGYTAEELLNMGPLDVTHPDDAVKTTDAVRGMIAGQIRMTSFDKRYIRKDGQIIWISLSTAVVPDINGEPAIGLATIQDISDRKLAEFLEHDRRNVLEMVAREMPLGEVLSELAWAVERQIHGSSAAVLRLQDGTIHAHVVAAKTPYQAVLQSHGLRLATYLSGQAWETDGRCGVTDLQGLRDIPDLARLLAEMKLQTAWAMPIESNDGSPLGVLVSFVNQRRNPTASEMQTLDMCRKLAAICIDHHNTTRQLAHLVRHDSLTGIANRLLFEDRVQHALALARRNDKNVGVMLLDVDRFKSINDSLGHNAGDHLLQQFAQRLNSKIRQTDTMARIGGDEFAVVLPDIDGPQSALVVARKFKQALAEPFDVVSSSINVTASIGIALFPHHGDNAVELLKKADQALYRVKQRGRNDFSLA
jgi:diguanylate cyclase (GGDEF)-like protein/PAS domain S-box-containing protein